MPPPSFPRLEIFFASEGKPGPVLKIVARSRTGPLNIVACMRQAILEHWGKDKQIGLGGVLLVKDGNIRSHIMPGFPPCNLADNPNVEWLKYFEVPAPLTCLSVFVSSDTHNDTLRLEHTHFFSTRDHGGHYHYDTTPVQVYYEGYYNVASLLYRIGKACPPQKEEYCEPCQEDTGSKTCFQHFDGKRALVTGGKGIGRQVCIDLARCGAFVVAVSRTQEDLNSLKSEIQQMGRGGIQIIRADLSKVADIKRVVKEAGDIDFLVNNAGVSTLKSVFEHTEEDWDYILNVNLKAVFLLTQLVCQRMVENKKAGVVCNVSSQASSIGLDKHLAYCVSKGGLDQLTRVMALELGPHGVRVNSVNPTVVLTDMGKMAWSAPEKSGPMLAKIPLHKFCQPKDVSDAILFLLSDRASMITGVTLPVDGGFLSARL